MSLAKELETTPAAIEDITENVIFPPGDLSSDEPPWENEESERQQKEIAQQKAKRLAIKLQELNIDPDTI